MKKLLFFLLLFPLAVFSQIDVAATNVAIVGGEPFCPNSTVSFQVTFTNNHTLIQSIAGANVRIFVNGPNPTAAFNATVPAGNQINASGGTLTLTYPDDFTGPPAALDLSTPGIYTLTVSMTVAGDTVPANDVFTLNDIDVYTPATPSLSSTVAGIVTNTVCRGEAITFEISPNQATASYSFLVNGDVKQTAVGNNTFTSSTAGANAIADGDIITILMTDENGCTTDTSIQSISVSVDDPPTISLTSTAPEEYFCDGEAITFTATGGPTYSWYVDGGLISGAIGANYTTTLNDGQVVTVRVTNGSGCFTEESLTLQKLTVTNDGNIVLSVAGDSDICDGENPSQILGDGTGASAVATVSDGAAQYQWQYSNDGTSYFDIGGETATNYDPPALTTTTYYRRNVIVSPGTKECEIEGTDVIVINVRPEFTIGLSSTDPLNTFCQGETVTISANSGATNYEFFVNGVSQQNGASEQYIIQTGASRNLAAPTDILQNGDNINVTVTDNFGCITSETIVLVVDDVGLNPALSTNAPGDIICSGQSIEITASGGTNYNFFINNSGNPALPGEVSGAVFTTTRLVDGDQVIARVSNASGCYIDVTETFQVLTLTDPGDIMFTNAADSSICYGAALAGTIDGDGAPPAGSSAAAGSDVIGYQWQSSTDGSNWGDIAGATAANYAPGGNFTVTTRFRRIAFTFIDTNGNGVFDESISCGNRESNILTVNVGADFDPDLQTGVLNDFYCAGTTAIITAAAGATTYEFEINGASVQGPNATRTLTRVTGSGAGEIDDGDIITVNAVIGGCTFTEDIVIGVDFFGTTPVASLSSNATGDTICSGDSITITAGPAGYSNYEFEIDGFTVQNGAGNTLTTTAITANAVVQVTVTNAAGCSDTETLNVIVPDLLTPGDVTTPADTTICLGEDQPAIVSAAVGTVAVGDAVAYQWQYRPVGGAWQDIVGSTAAGLAAAQVNLTTTSQFRRLAFSTRNTVSCEGTASLVDGNPGTITITVDNRVIPTVTNNDPDANNIICDSFAIVFTAGGTLAGDTISWLVDGNPVGVATQVWSPAAGTINDGEAVSVQITTAAPGGCTYTSVAQTITVQADLVATLASNATGDTICSGDSITITAGPVGQANYQFELGVGNVVQNGAGNTLTTTAITASTAVIVTVTNAAGCSDTETLNVIVPDLLTPGDVTTPADTTICLGEDQPAIVSAAVGTVAVGDAVAYQWQYRPVGGAWQDIVGSTAAGLAAAQVVLTTTSQFRRLAFSTRNTVSCEGTASLVDGNPGTITITVDNRVIPTVTNNDPDANNIICDSFAIVFTAGGTLAGDTISWLVDGNPVGVATQVWSPAAGTINDGEAVSVQITTAAPGGCTYTSVAQTITVQADPIATITSDATGDTICSGDSITITAGPVGQANYQFELGVGNVVQNGAGNTLTTTAITASTAVIVTVTNAAGCSDTETLNVIVPDLLTPGDVTTPADTTICLGEDQPAIVSAAVGTVAVGDAVAYQWQYRPVGGAWQDIVGSTAAGLAAAQVVLTTTSQFRRLAFSTRNTVSCEGTASLVDGNPGTITITVDNRVIPTVTNNDPDANNIICDSFAIVFTAGGTLAGDTISWLVDGNPVGVATQVWSPAAGTINDGEAVSVQITTAAPGGCTYTSVAQTITVQADLVATLASNATGDTICSGDSITITAGPVGQANYQFELGVGNVVQNGAGNTLTTTAITASTAVIVTVTNAAGCSDTETLNVIVPDLLTPGDVTTPADTTICLGEDQPAIVSAAVGTVAVGDAVAYQWQYRPVGGAWQDIVGSTAAGLAAAQVVLTTTSQFRRLAFSTRNTVSCEGTASLVDGNPGTITITVDNRVIPTVTNNDPDANNIICDSFAIVFTAGGTLAGDTISWLVDGNPVGVATQVWSPAAGTINDGEAVSVQITTAAPGGCTYTSVAQTITVQADPIATITSDATGDTICSGDSITITAGPVGQANYQFELGVGNVVQNGAGNTLTTTAITASTAVIVTVTNAAGCSDTETLNVIVPDLLTPGDVTTPADTTICLGEDQPAIVSAAVGTVAVGDAVAYQWQYRPVGGAWQDIVGSTAAGLAAAQVVLTTTSQFRRLAFSTRNTVSCEGTASLVDGNPGTITITVDNRVIPTVTNNDPDANNIICDSFAIVFTAGGTLAGDTISWLVDGNPVGVATQVWSPAAGTINDGEAVSVQITTAAPGGCTYTSVAQTITVQADPIATITSDATGDTICSGDSITITAGPVGQANYQFELGVGNVVQNGAGNTLTTTAITASTAVIVTVTNAAGCSDTETLNVIVPDLLTPGDVTTPADTTICLGEDQPAIVSAAVGTVGGTAAVAYQWQYRPVGGAWQDIVGSTAAGLAAAQVVLTTTSQFRRLAFATENGVSCEGTVSLVDGNPGTITITVDNRVIPTVTNNDPDANNIICDSFAIVFTAGGTLAGDTISWLVDGNPVGVATQVWSPAAGTINDGEAVSVQITTAAPGGCTYTSVAQTITVQADPIATLASNATGDTICSGDSITITAGPVGQANYQFELGVGNVVQNGAGNTLTTTAITASTAVIVTVTNAAGCSDTETLNVIVPDLLTPGDVTTPADTTICLGEDQPAIVSAAVGTVAVGDAVAYQWQYRPVGGAWQDIVGSTAAGLAAAQVVLTTTSQFRRLAFSTRNTVSCEGTASLVDGNPGTITITVDNRVIPTVTNNDPDANNIICDSFAIVFTAGGTLAGDTISWLVDGNPVGVATQVWSPAAGTINDGEAVSVQITTAAPGGCTYTSVAQTITVQADPIATITSDASANTICGGLSGGVPFADTVLFTSPPIAGASYQFFFGANPVSPVQAANTFSTDDFSIYDTDLTFQVGVQITTAAGCTDTATMNINLNYVTADGIQIAGGALTQNICNGTAPAGNFVSVGAEDAPDGTDDFVDGADYPNGAAITYQWENRTTGAWSPITGANARTYTAPILYENTEFRRRSISTLSGQPCEEVSNIITINVAGALAGGQVQRNTGGAVWVDQTEIICVGNSPQELRIINDTAGPGVDYQWQYSADNITWEDITIANGYAADANAFQYQPAPVTLSDIRSIHTLQIVAPLMATDGDFYRITVGGDVFTVEVGEDNSTDIAGGDGDIDTIAEVIEYLAFKINDLGAGITATQDGVDTITYTLAPGSTLTPVIRVDDGGADVTAPANSVANQTYNGQGNTRFYRRLILQNFVGAVLPLCQTFSDVHTVEVNTIIAGSIDNADPVICYNTQPSTFTSKRNAYSTAAGAVITYEWYRTTDVARTNWVQIVGETNQDLTFTTALTQSTSFRRKAISTYGPDPTVCEVDTAEFTITVLDEVNPGNILANQSICRIDGAPLTVDVADLVAIVATNVETDDGSGDGILYQWQFSADNTNWDDIIAGDRSDLLDGGFAATLNTAANITAAQQDADIERRLRTLIDPDIATTIYYRLTTTRFNDTDDDNTLDAGELECEVISPVTQIDISAQPTIVQTSGPANTQTVCTGDAITTIVFEYGGSATGVDVNGEGGLAVVNDALAQTVTISGTPATSLNISLRTTGTTCEVEFINYTITRVLNRPAPDYITIDDSDAGTPANPIPIIDNQDANVYDGQQSYLCETAINTGPDNTLFDVCFNNGRLPPTNGYLWEIRTPGAGSINPATGEVDWTDGFFGDAIIRVYAYACDGTTPAAFREAVVTVNEFEAAATQPTEPVPLLEAEVERVTISPIPAGNIRAGEKYNISLNGVRYTFETTDVVLPIDGDADEDALDIAENLRDQINNDTTSPIAGLFNATAFAFNPGDINNNGLLDDVGAFITITAQYDGNSAPPIPPGVPRGYGGDMDLVFSVTRAPGEGRAFGNMTGIEINETSAIICGDLTGAEPWCETTAITPNTQYFSSASFYTDIRYAISSVVPGVGSVVSPGVIDATTGELNWNAGFYGTFIVESYATGCDGVENISPGIHNVRIYPDLDPPTDITFDPLTLPDCPAQTGDTTDFNSSDFVTWSWNNDNAGEIDSVTGLVTWADGFSGSVVITATSFGCGGGSLSITVSIPDLPRLSRTSALGTMTQNNICVGSNINTIRFEILGGATGVDVTGLPNGVNEGVVSVDQINTVTLSSVLDEDNDIHTVTINGTSYSVERGEDNSIAIPGGDGDVDTLLEVLELLEDKINNAALGITASDAGGVLTLTSNGFDFDLAVSLTDVDANDGETIVQNETQNGGRFVEIIGAPNVVITERTTYPFTIRTTGSVCVPDEAVGSITVGPISTITIQAGMDDNQQVCNNSPGVLTDIVYDVTNATSVDVSWAPSRPLNINSFFVTQNQISTITLGGVNADVVANDTEDYTVTINGTPYTYTVNIGAPQNDNEISDIVNGLRDLINVDAGTLQLDATVVGGNVLTLTSRNGGDFTVLDSDPNLNAAIFGAADPTEVQTGERTVSIAGDPAVPGLVADTVYTYTLTTQNSEFGCNLPANQQSVTGNITISPEPTITLLPGGSDNLSICAGESISDTQGGNDIVWEIEGFATNASIDTAVTPLPAGVIQNYNEVSQITDITFDAAPAEVDLDNTDTYIITINGNARTVTVDTGLPSIDTFVEILQAFETDIDANVTGVDATLNGTILTLESTAGNPITIVFGGTGQGDAADPNLSQSTTQTSGKFFTLSGIPTGAAGIFNYTINTNGGACASVSYNGTIRVLDQPTISVSAGSDANPNNVCNLSPMTPIQFDITGFSAFSLTWTGPTPPGIGAFLVNPTTLEVRSTPVVNVPGPIPVGGINYQYRIASTINDNGCITQATFDGTIRVVEGSETITFDATSYGTPTDVDLDGTVDLSTAPDNVLVEVCQDTALTNVVFDGSVGIANIGLGAASDPLPSGLSGNWDPVANTYTISGTPDTPTTANLILEAITLAPNAACTPADDVRVRIVVWPTSTISLNAGSNDNQTICTNAALTDIIYTVGGGAQGATIAGLPAGLSGVFNAPNTFTISGNPTTVITETQIYNYTVTTTGNTAGATVPGGSCLPEATITGTITVLPEESLTHNAATGALTQDVCYGDNITPIEIVVVGDNTFATVTPPANLPSGVNFNFIPDADNMGGIVTISGSPDPIVNTPTTYTFDISTGAIGNTSICADDTETITLNVNPQSTLIYAGAVGLDNQESCDGTSIQEIRYTLGGGAADVTVNFQAGLGFTRAANVRVNDPGDPANSVVIYGTPNLGNTETRVFTYTITTVNPNTCLPEITLNGSISVLPAELLTHNAATGALTQDVCYGADIVPIEIDVVGANTFATVDPPADLPSGVNFDFVPDADTMGGVLTISGSPDAIINSPTTYTFTVSTGAAGNTSVCADDTQIITLNVNPQSSIAFTGPNTLLLNQSVCGGNDIQEIQYTIGGGATDITVNFPAGLGFTRAANVRVNDPSDPANSVVLYGSPSVVAAETTFPYTITTVNQFTCLPEVTLGGSFTVFPPISYNNFIANTSVNNPLCDGDSGSIVVDPSAITGGITAQAQQTQVEIDNLSSVGDQITFTIQGETFTYTVQGFDNALGTYTNFPALGDRPLSRAEILPIIANLINDPLTGSRYATATPNSPTAGIMTLVAETPGIPFSTAVSYSIGSTGSLVSNVNTVANQTLSYAYYWRRAQPGSNPGVALTTLDTSDPSTYVGTGLTLNVPTINATESYMLTTISNGCDADSPVVALTAPPALALAINSICDTEIIATASGGIAPFTYVLKDSSGTEIGRSNPTFGNHTFTDGDSNNIPGIPGSVNITPGFEYEVGVLDNNNCSLGGNNSTVTVRTPRGLEIDNSDTNSDGIPDSITVVQPTCGSDGSIELNTGGFTITGGSAGNTGDYTNIIFNWLSSNGNTYNTQNISGLIPGDYTLTVTDNTCNTLFATSIPIRIDQSSDFTVVAALDNSNISNCSDGHLEVLVTGGSGNFTYAWTDQFGVARGNTDRIEDLDAGTYTLVVEDTTTNCDQTFTYVIDGSSGPLQMLDPVAVNQANFTTTEILCNGAANGAFTVEFTGGNPPYQYSLNGGAYLTNGFTTSTTSVTTGSASSTVVSYTTQVLSLNSLEGGTYSVKIKDSGLCTDSGGNLIELNLGSVTINEPDPLSIELNASTTQEIDCSAGIQGSLGVNITGGTVSGTTPYSILWELYGPSGEVLYKRTTSGSPSDPDDLTITGLDYAGDYTITVTDAAGCFISEVITLEDGSNEDPLTVGEIPIVSQPGCNSDELGGIELELSGGVQPYDIKWYKLAAASDNALSLTTSGTGTGSSTLASSTLVFSDGGYVSMNKDGFYLIDSLEPGKYRAIITDATGCQIFSRSGIIKTSSFNMVKQKVFNREVLDCELGIVEADFSFRLTGTSLAYNIFLDGELVYGGSSSASSSGTVVSPTFASSIIKSGSSFIIRGLSEGRHIVEAQDATNTNCSLDYAFDIETYVPITFEGETEFEFDVCENGFPFELDTTNIIGGNPIIDDNDNVIYNLRWTYTPSDPNQPGSSFVGRTNFEAGRGTYQLIISDGTCESDPIDFVFSGDVNVLSIDGLLLDANGSVTTVQGVSCELGARDGRISIDITGGQEPYDVSWEIFDASNPVLTPVSTTLSGTTNQVSPWRLLDGSYPGLGNFEGFSTLNELPAGLYRYTIRSASTCPNPIDTPFNYLQDVISVDDDTTLVITDGPYVDYKLCEGLPGLIIIDAVNNSDTNSQLNFFYINTNGTEDIGDDGQPIALNGNTTKLDEDTYQILIDTPYEYGKIVITTDQGCGVEAEFNLALGDPFFSYTSPSFEQVNEIPAREEVTFRDESEGEFSRLEWSFGDNSESIILDVSATASGVTQVNHSYGNSGTYYPTLTIYNEIGCFESITNPITIGRGYSIYVPNVFSPNNDCLNDYFRPLFTGFESLIFNVYDNRGNLIYSEEAQDGSIDRSDCPDSIDSSGNGKSILGWDGNGFDGLTMDAFSPYFVYTIYAVPLNRVTPDQTIERSGIFTLLK